MTGLTKRQAEVQQLVEQKLTAEAIATKLGLSVGTVNAHKTRMRQRRADRPITGREKQVIELIGQGLTDTDISARLEISPRTVEVHRQSVMAKYKARNTPHLMTILHQEATGALQIRIAELEAAVARLKNELSTLRDGTA
jgi:DNA-binding CsgD family transcriptional regulator